MIKECKLANRYHEHIFKQPEIRISQPNGNSSTDMSHNTNFIIRPTNQSMSKEAL